MDIEKKLNELRNELAKANGLHEEHRMNAQRFRDLALQISGAIQILTEQLANGKVQPLDTEPAKEVHVADAS